MNNLMLRSAAAAAVAAIFPMAAIGAPCDAKVGQDSVCFAEARLVLAMSANLPAVDGMVTVETVRSKNNIVTVGGKFDLDKAGGAQFLARSKMNLKQLEDSYAAQIKPKLCSAGSQTRQIIDAGGTFMYSYTYRDGKPFMMFGVKKCH